jgi:hypothetical protein
MTILQQYLELLRLRIAVCEAQLRHLGRLS